MFAEFGPRRDALARDQLFLRSIYDSKATFLGRSDEDRFILRNASRQSPMGVRSVVSSSARICLKHLSRIGIPAHLCVSANSLEQNISIGEQ